MNALKLTYQKIQGKQNTHPILILHGLFGNWQNNRSLATHLTSLGQDIYLPNLRNHGTSPQSSRMTYNDLSSDIFRFVEDHRINDPILIGHSLGAKTVMNCCLQRPNLAYAMVCIENTPNVQPINYKFVGYIDQLQKVILECNTIQDARKKLNQVEENSFVVGFLLTLLQRHEDKLTSKVPLKILKENLLQGNIGDWPLSTGGKDMDHHDKQKPEIVPWDKPSLFIKGSKSHLMKLESIAEYFTRAQIVEVEGSHFVNTEKPVEVAEKIVQFVSGLGSNH